MTTGETFGYFLVRDTNTQPLPLPGLDSDRIAVVRGPPGLEQTYWASLHAGGGGIGIVADGVWSPLAGATVALGSDTVTVSGAAFTAADIGKRFTMKRGGSPASFAGAAIVNRGTGYRAGDVVTHAGVEAGVLSVTATGGTLIGGGSGGPASASFIVKGLTPGRRGKRDAARFTVTTNASGVVTAIVQMMVGGIYINPAFTGVNEPFYSVDYPGLTGLVITIPLGVRDIRRKAAGFYGRVTGTALTVEEMVYGTIVVGDVFSGVEVVEGTTITALGTGSGGVGTYTLSATQTAMADNIWLYVSETPSTTTTPAAGTISPAGGSGTGLAINAEWRGIPLVGNIVEVLGPTQIRLDVTAASAATNVGYAYGTDYGPQIQAALDAGQEVSLPSGVICHSVPLVYKARSRLIGCGASLGTIASTTLAYVGPYMSRGKQLGADAHVGGNIDGATVGNFLLYGNNLIGIGHYQRGVSGSEILPMTIRGHTYIGLQMTGALSGAQVGNVNSSYIVREIDSPGWDVTGIYIGPGEQPNPATAGVNDVCRSWFPYWQVDTDLEGFGRPIWYRAADSNSHGFVKTRGPIDLPGIEFAGHDMINRNARAIHFNYCDPNSMRLRAGMKPSSVTCTNQNFLNGSAGTEVDGAVDATEDDDFVTVEPGARFFGISNQGQLNTPRLRPYHRDTIQTPLNSSWIVVPVTDSNTAVPGAAITANGPYQVLAYTDNLEVLRVLSPTSLPTAGAYTVATLPTTGRIGARLMVSDATAPTFLATVVGGGAVRAPVFWDDSGAGAWKVG